MVLIQFCLLLNFQVANGHPVSHVSFRDSSRENVSLRQPSVPAAAVNNCSGGPDGVTSVFAGAVTSLSCTGNSTAAMAVPTGNGATNESLEVTNLIKHASISDDHLLQDRRSRQVHKSGAPCLHVVTNKPYVNEVTLNKQN